MTNQALAEADANRILEAIGAEYGWTKETSAFPIVVEDELRDGNWWEPADLSSRAAFEAQARKYYRAAVDAAH